MGKLHYGTASWSEESWDGVFYPSGTAPGDYLTYYSSQFTTVEANVTYYRVPSRELVSGWDRKTPDGFTLAAKFPRSIVHAGDGPRPDPDVLLDPEKTGRDVEQFLDSMDLLGPKCGPLVLQFPYLNKKAFATAEPFLARLDLFLAGLPDRFRYAVEIRNRNWLRPELCEVLRSHRTALVLTDLHYMPHPARVAEDLDVATTDFLYGRLIGDRKAIDAVTSAFDRVVLDQSSRLQRWAALMSKLLPGVGAAYLYANNHYAGHAPSTIRELADMIEGATAEE
jgi:uncharacterized protein YecE (DUF72 family)